jgi:hypothetical protein
VTTRITLGAPSEGITVQAGVEFVNGVAELGELGPNKRRYFEATGATVEEVAADGRGLDELTRAELLAIIDDKGLEVKTTGKVPELAARVQDALDARAQASIDEAAAATAQTFAENTVRLVPGEPGNADTGAVDNGANTAEA